MSRRAARRQARTAAERRAQRRTMLGIVAVVVALLVAAAVVVTLLGGGSDLDTEAAPVDQYPYRVQMFPPDPGGRNHFALGQVYNYNSNPPTSGPHTAFVSPGVSDVPVPKEQAVHNMEHGHVVVWYNCGGGPQPLGEDECSELRSQLAELVERANANGTAVLMTPYRSSMGHRIALTAWQFLDEFDEFDRDRVQTFIDTFYCHTDLEGFCR